MTNLIKRTASMREFVETHVIPEDALVLGKCQDDKPLLFNYGNNGFSNFVLWGDAENGTKFLMSVARYISFHLSEQSIVYLVFTDNPDRWTSGPLGFRTENILNPECIGIFPLYHQMTDDAISSILAYSYRDDARVIPIIMFIDGLQDLSQLDWGSTISIKTLLGHGYQKSIFTIAHALPDFQDREKWEYLFNSSGVVINESGDYVAYDQCNRGLTVSILE